MLADGVRGARPAYEGQSCGFRVSDIPTTIFRERFSHEYFSRVKIHPFGNRRHQGVIKAASVI
jgi:hypothetical protein